MLPHFLLSKKRTIPCSVSRCVGRMVDSAAAAAQLRKSPPWHNQLALSHHFLEASTPVALMVNQEGAAV
jgi:hypothetical protein